jgi:DNA-directed RNA polymerase specialized sigma24 family protein
VLDEAALAGAEESGAASPLAALLSQEPCPEFVAQMAEECQRLLGLLADPQLRQVALAKMERYTVEEIAAQQGVAPRTVQRWLRLIRRTWAQELEP